MDKSWYNVRNQYYAGYSCFAKVSNWVIFISHGFISSTSLQNSITID